MSAFALEHRHDTLGGYDMRSTQFVQHIERGCVVGVLQYVRQSVLVGGCRSHGSTQPLAGTPYLAVAGHSRCTRLNWFAHVIRIRRGGGTACNAVAR